jgi:hypothetical protein
MSRGRGATGWLSPRQVVDFGEAIRALLRAEPFLQVRELVHRTGAPAELVTLVRKRWLTARATP